MYRQLLGLLGLFHTVVHAVPTNSDTSGSERSSHKGYTFGKSGINATFDYVVIGGGTAGLTVATRLAGKAGISVAVIEAGGFYEQETGNLSLIPGNTVLFDGTTPGVGINILTDWNFTTVPQTAINNRVLHYTRGKTLGGSSAVNNVYYQRPTTGSLQKWADEVGDQSFTFPNLLPYYKKSVHFTPPTINYKNSTNQQDSSVFSQSGGPLQVSFGRYDDPWSSWSQKGFRAIGQALIKGFSSGKLIGTSFIGQTVDPTTEIRSSSESSFLESVKALNTKLTIYNKTFAEKIIFSGTENRAEGVVVAPEGENGPSGGTYALFARKEVILSAGAFQSPQMLMVSGIGPPATLRAHSIPVVHPLPGVGQNLQDQPLFGTTFRVNLAPVPSTASQISQYHQNPPTGPLTSSGNPAIGWDIIPWSLLNPSTNNALDHYPADWPSLEWLPSDASLSPTTATGVYHSMLTCLLRPFSRGTVSLASPHMATPPLIDLAYLSSPADQDQAIAAFKRQRQFWSNISAITIGDETVPGPSVQTDAEILAFIKSTVGPIWHASATCKMGKSGDGKAVVDSKFRVFGTKGLRVVDASVFPFLPPGHPQSTVYALAEKAAVEILEG